MKISKYIKVLTIVLVIVVCAFSIHSDDKELFIGASDSSTTLRPNVVILMDSSGSMNTIIFYPKDGVDGMSGTSDDGYDALTSYSGSVDGFTSSTNYLSSSGWYARWIRSGNARDYGNSTFEGWSGKNFWTGCYGGDGSTTNFQVGGYSVYFRVGDKVIFRDTSAPYNSAVATIKRRYQQDGNNWFELEDIQGGPITVNGGQFQQSPDGQNWEPTVVQLYGTSDNGQSVRYPRNYLEWAYIHSSDDIRKAISHFSTWGTFDVTQTPGDTLSNCATPGNNDLGGSNPRLQRLFTRIQTAREVICKVASDSNTIVKLGLFKFNGTNGASLVEGLEDMSDESSLLVAYKNNVWDIYGDSWTPLAESLADIWYYYKPGPTSKTYWPVDYEIESGSVNHPTSNPVGPIDYWCQSNYVVLMTDGESSKDKFDDSSKYGDSIFKNRPISRSEPWEDWDDGWGDADNNDDKDSGYLPPSYNPNGTYCPNYTCWITGSGGTDLLDDVAYFIRNQDMYPDDHFGTDSETGWPGDQKIYTYTIGFAADNDMLLQTAVNGEGAYYTASNYEELVEAFLMVITNINLRNFAFSAITAPKKSSTASSADSTTSYVGYFLPAANSAFWEGHLLAFELEDRWGYDLDGNGMTPDEFTFATEEECVPAAIEAGVGNTCSRWVSLAIGHKWDATDKISAARNLFTHNETTTLIDFDSGSQGTLKPLFGAAITDSQADNIISTILTPRFGDVFHSDVGYVGAPPFGKQYIPNIDPPEDGDETYATYYEANKNRLSMIYVGTNDGIMHSLYADDDNNPGVESWGFIPDEVLPSFPQMVLEQEHTYTVDGRITVADVWFPQSGSANKWATAMYFGLRRGGNAYYALDITQLKSSPDILWKFKDAEYSGQSWGKPSVGRVKYTDSDGVAQDKYVVFVTGGFAFNSENPDDSKGKSLFMLDAGTGELLWMIGYNSSGAPTTGGTGQEVIETTQNGNKYLTKSDLFNFCIPSALTAIDRDNDGYIDTLFYGNVGGHLFKTDITPTNVTDWKTYVVFKRPYIVDIAKSKITNIDGDEITVQSKVFTEGDPVMGELSYAQGYIKSINNKILTVQTLAGTFQVDEDLITRNYDPIYLSPAVAFDTCYSLWIAFGTGDRDRPRTNTAKGRFVAIKDNDSTNYIEDSSGTTTSSTLQEVTWGAEDADGVSNMNETDVSNANGWYFDYVNDGEKMFDPEPIFIPDENFIPHLYFNSLTPPGTGNTGPQVNPCTAPGEGSMKLFDISIISCGTTELIGGERTTGRLAGGGNYAGKEYVIYKSTSGNVADVPGGEGGNFSAVAKRLPYAGGVIYWKEKKR